MSRMSEIQHEIVDGLQKGIPSDDIADRISKWYQVDFSLASQWVVDVGNNEQSVIRSDT